MFQEYASQIQASTKLYLGYDLSDKQIQDLSLFGDLLLDWNQKLNLTRILDPQEIILKHFIDSMVLASYIQGTKFVDLGTGAGFPGIPLKILRPDLKVFLVDSLKKRLDFIDIVISRLGLKETRTIHSRAEDFGRDHHYRGQFDTVTCRAVARLPVLVEFALPVLKVNGLFLSPKGLQAQEELDESIAALNLLGGKVESLQRYSLGESAEHRAIISIRKIKETPPAYPRKAGIPAKHPLL
ncbi:16S rRNA (guanine(527)-N(7))-methyltransferase RsmG [Desulfosporosinus sp. PR]|uniref:16S rRNA (guanine(527)-N(7))-methyltransferase RsmG n=1 Tax=Candidatus Desulfosporosinus nitrosoreducens TaxID=3401928 RepID=UPI0027EF16B3|nr:16S rRNA (guanine(527)-N(7))-methyltransferase RsmG [Desulfosporosinus sp. PR]MDQ7092460.1 16S rRNA (guanine(527)-N(7))-methyltransferase RsmG [Desulfosporosinus sp. PR]